MTLLSEIVFIFKDKIRNIMTSQDDLFPKYTSKIIEARAKLAPEHIEAWQNFSKTVFKKGVIPESTKHLIAIAVAHVTQCPYCIRSHTKQALRMGVSKEEIVEATWVAAEMRAGAAIAHAALAVDEIVKYD